MPVYRRRGATGDRRYRSSRSRSRAAQRADARRPGVGRHAEPHPMSRLAVPSAAARSDRRSLRPTAPDPAPREVGRRSERVAAREVVHVAAVSVGRERAQHVERRLPVLARGDMTRRERAAFADRTHLVRDRSRCDHRAQEVRVQRVQTASRRRVPSRGDDRLRDHETTEEHRAEPRRRVADPSASGITVRTDRQELQRLRDHGAAGSVRRRSDGEPRTISGGFR